jgi:thioredoxin 1
VIFNKSNFEEFVVKSDKPVMVDFWATWCPPCNAMTPVVEKLAREWEGKAAVGKVNISEEQELSEKYNIASIPAFLFFKNGKPQKQLTLLGVQTEETLQKRLESLVEDT